MAASAVRTNNLAMDVAPRERLSCTVVLGTVARIAEAIRARTAPIFREAIGRGSSGRYVRSMSTDSLGISRRKRLMAVPPFNAKQVSAVTCGMTLNINCACLKYGLFF